MLDATRPSVINQFSSNGQRNSREGLTLNSLKQVPLFKGVSPQDLRLLAGAIKHRVLIPDEELLTEDETDDALFFIMEGAFKITVRKGEGTVLLALCGRGDLLGELAAIDGQARSATVTAQTPCLVGSLSSKSFWDTVWPINPIPLNMAHLLAGRVRRLTAKVQAMATLDVRGRLAFQIVSLARDHGMPEGNVPHFIPFGLTQAELAQMVGTSRVQVNQLMMTWSKHGYMTTKRNAIAVHNIGALCQMFPASLEASIPKSAQEFD